MVELVRTGPRTLGLGFAGDSFNTAVYLARSLGDVGRVDYISAVGTDRYSAEMVDFWRAEGIGTGRVARVPGGRVGLYLVSVDSAGERSFTYYRSDSAARSLFDSADPFAGGGSLSDYSVVYLSGITLSILSDPGREQLWRQLAAVRAAGGVVAFDSNYRPAGWPSTASAVTAVETTLDLTDIALPSLDDESALYGDASPRACVDRLSRHGVKEIALTMGRAGALVVSDRSGAVVVPASPDVGPVLDTTAAGDSFNGAYLAGRLGGRDPIDAAAAGAALAAGVITQRGAIIGS